jgi:hypothetical protein
MASSTKPLCVAWSFKNPFIVAKKPKMVFDVTFGLLIIGSWSSGDLKQLVLCYSYNLNKVKIMFYLHMFFHGSNTICFVVSSNETFITPSAQSSNFKATCMIVVDYASHDLVHIHGLVVIRKNPCWWVVIIRLPSNSVCFQFFHVHFR